MVLLIDNYDSFSYNLVQAVGEVSGGNVLVRRNDEISIEEIKDINPDAIILSPGPGKPENAGICEDVVRNLKGEYPILGVCLGHQAICEVFGARVTYAKTLMHGKKGIMKVVKDDPIFEGIEERFEGARYHSLSVDKDSIPEELLVLAIDENDDEIMAIKHKEYEIYGLQFHPESVLTPCGKEIIRNFVKLGLK